MLRGLHGSLWMHAGNRPVCSKPDLFSPILSQAKHCRVRQARLIATNFKQSDGQDQHSTPPHLRPPPSQPPLTDPCAGAGVGAAEAATRKVALPTVPQTAKKLPLKDRLAKVFQGAVHLASRPGLLMRGLLQSATYALPFGGAAYLARQPLASFWSSYCAALEQQPLLTKIATGVVGTLIGDLLAQWMNHANEQHEAEASGEASTQGFAYDAGRALRLVAYGVFIGTPIAHYWFNMLDTRIWPQAMTSPATVLTKVCLDQIVACPLVNALFFMVMRASMGHPGDAWDYMCSKLRPTLVANYMLWPLAHIINFALVPPSQRILYINAVMVVWTVIMSNILHSKPKSVSAA